MTIDKLIELAKSEFTGIDEQIHVLESSRNEVQSKIASYQGYTPEDARRCADLRTEETELQATLTRAISARKDKATAFAKKVALPNMRKIEDNWRDGLQKKYQSQIDKLHQMIHNAKNLHEELRVSSSTEKEAFRKLSFSVRTAY